MRIESKIAGSKLLNIQCNGWFNIRQEGIINIVIITPEPFFVDFVVTGGKSYS